MAVGRLDVRHQVGEGVVDHPVRTLADRVRALVLALLAFLAALLLVLLRLGGLLALVILGVGIGLGAQHQEGRGAAASQHHQRADSGGDQDHQRRLLLCAFLAFFAFGLLGVFGRGLFLLRHPRGP